MVEPVSRLTAATRAQEFRRMEMRVPMLESAHLHEVHASGADRAAALAFVLGFAPDMAAAGPSRCVVLVRAAGGAGRRLLPYGEGLQRTGIDPAAVLVVEAQGEHALLQATLEAARCPGVGLVLLETEARFAAYDLTASRRLALAVERSQVRAMVLRHDAAPRPSAAHTRWAVASAPSLALEAGAPGWSAIEVELLRWRGGPAGRRWRLEWDMEHGVFRSAADRAALSGVVVPLSGVREGSGEGGSENRPRAA